MEGVSMIRSADRSGGSPVRRPRSGLALMAAVLIAALSYPAINQAGGKQRQSKLDRVLQQVATNGDTSQQRVIVRARKGHSSAVAERLARHGGRIEARHR